MPEWVEGRGLGLGGGWLFASNQWSIQRLMQLWANSSGSIKTISAALAERARARTRTHTHT